MNAVSYAPDPSASASVPPGAGDAGHSLAPKLHTCTLFAKSGLPTPSGLGSERPARVPARVPAHGHGPDSVPTP